MSLSILAWDHPRATDPLAACAEEWGRLTGEQFLIRTRSLRSFGDDVPAGAGHDLVLIDHPHVGQAAADRAILPLDDLLQDADLAMLAADSAGASHASYEHDGHQWAVAIDAACQALAVNTTTPVSLAPTATWSGVLALADAYPGRVALPLQPAHAISALLSLLATREPPVGGPTLASTEALRWGTDVLATLAARGPSEAFDWEPPEALARLTASELVCIPLVYAYIGYDVGWRSAPAFLRNGKPGSILGGVGAAVLSGSSDPSGAARLAAWLGSSNVQLEFVRPAGGQPGTHSGWTAPGADRMFEAVLPTLEASQIRPRDAWWPAFQRDSGDLLARALQNRSDPVAIADDLARSYHEHREATS